MIAHPSPNHGARRRGAVPDMVVLHHTGMASAEAARARLCDPAAEVSAHYLVGEDGTLWALVPEDRRAWHAGAAHWAGVDDVNSRSIGIEIANPGEGPGRHPYPEPQMAALEALLSDVLARHAIPPERVVGHACVAPGRKADPGAGFDWRRLALGGLSVWLDPPERAPSVASHAPSRSRPPTPRAGAWDGAPPEPVRFAAAARTFGYGVGVGGGEGTGWDGRLLAIWQAFALRFRPTEAGGPPTAAGLAHLEALAARWPARRA